MKVTVKYIKTHSILNVRRVGALEGQIMGFTNSLRLAREIDRLALRGRRMVIVGDSA